MAVDVETISKAFEQMIASSKNGETAKRNKHAQYNSWAIPNNNNEYYPDYLFKSEIVFPEQVFFDNTAEQQSASDINKIEILNKIRNIQDNWDGRGAVVPQICVFENAETFLSGIPKSINNELKQDGIFPTPYGTLVLEWHNIDEFVSVEIGEKELGFFSEFKDGSNASIDKMLFTDSPIEILTSLKKLYA